MATARVKAPLQLENLSAEARQELLNNIPLSDENRLIAEMRFIYEYCLDDIAEDVGHTRKTVSNRLVHIMNKIKKAKI